MDTHQQLDEKDYLKQRVEDQLDWFERKSAWNQKWYKRLKLAVIVFSVSIPLLVGFVEGDMDWLKIVIGVLGVIIAGIEGALSLYKFQDNWIQYRATAEALKRESRVIQYIFRAVKAPAPEAARPRASVVIPVYNQAEHTEACLYAIAENTGALS